MKNRARSDKKENNRFMMRRLLIALFLLLVPSAQALDYVECEAIKAVIDRNSIQKKQAFEDSYDNFKSKKIKERYGKLCVELGYSSPKYSDCTSYERSIWRFHKEEGNTYRKSLEARYQAIEERAKNDFTNEGCYW